MTQCPLVQDSYRLPRIREANYQFYVRNRYATSHLQHLSPFRPQRSTFHSSSTPPMLCRAAPKIPARPTCASAVTIARKAGSKLAMAAAGTMAVPTAASAAQERKWGTRRGSASRCPFQSSTHFWQRFSATSCTGTASSPYHAAVTCTTASCDGGAVGTGSLEAIPDNITTPDKMVFPRALAFTVPTGRPIVLENKGN